MRCFLAQDYITLRGGTAGTVITQSATSWLDLSAFQDIVTWLDVKEFSGGTVQVAYQTSPTKDDALFVNIAGPFSLALGVTVNVYLASSVTNPLAKFFRWQLTVTGSTPPWDATFRLWLAANAPGPWQGSNMPPATLMAMVPGANPSVPIQVQEGGTTAGLFSRLPSTGLSSTGLSRIQTGNTRSSWNPR
jgi:hypothetical protein